jgi:hypothetical protein
MLLLHDRSSSVVPAFRRTVDTAPLRVRVALAAGLFAAVWWGTRAALDAAGMSHTPAGALLAGAIPAFALLPAPWYLEHLMSALKARAAALWTLRARVPHRRLDKHRA